jgi:hypothetical protein
MSNTNDILLSIAMQSWDASDPRGGGHDEKWKAEVAIDNAQSRLTVILTDGQGQRQSIGIEIDGRQVGVYANTDVHHDAPLLAAKIGQNEAFVFEPQNTTGTDQIIRIDENGFSKVEAIAFSDDAVPAAKR